MTKVKVDVQLLVTGGDGDGKTAIMHCILNAIQSDKGLQSICKLHPTQSYEILRGELARLTFTGELVQNTEMKKPSSTYSKIPGYPDTEEMLRYMESTLSEAQLSKAMKDPKAHDEGLELLEACVKPTVITHTDESGKRTEYKPFKVRLSGKSGLMFAYNGQPLKKTDRVITLLADVGTSAVGMHQDDAQTAESQGQTGGLVDYTLRMATTAAGKEYVSGFDSAESGKDRTASVTIQDGRVQGVASMERLAGETDAEYRNRHKLGEFIVIPAYVPIQEGATAKPNAHINGAAKTLFMLIDSVADKFQPVTYEEGVYPCGLVAGNKVQVIFDNGDMVTGAVSEFPWRKGSSCKDIVYWRRM